MAKKDITTTRQARRQAERDRQQAAQEYIDFFVSVFHNSVTFDNLPPDLPKRYLLRKLLEGGKIAYDKETGLYLPCNGIGIDLYGLPEQYQLYGANGYVVVRPADDVVILRLNDIAAPLAPFIARQSELIADFDTAIIQNLDAIRTMTIYEYNDEAQALTVVNELNARRIGSVALIRNKNALQGVRNTATSTGAQFLIDKLQDARQRIINETLTRIGISSANTDKREQVQAAEVVASQGVALDALYTFIDTFNHDAECGGLSIRARANTSVVDLLGIDPLTGELDMPDGEPLKGQEVIGANDVKGGDNI